MIISTALCLVLQSILCSSDSDGTRLVLQNSGVTNVYVMPHSSQVGLPQQIPLHDHSGHHAAQSPLELLPNRFNVQSVAPPARLAGGAQGMPRSGASSLNYYEEQGFNPLGESGMRSRVWRQATDYLFSWAPLVKNSFNAAYHYVKSHKWSVAGKTILALYIGVNYLLFRLTITLLSPDRLIYWKHQLSLTELMNIPPKMLAAELLVSGGDMRKRNCPLKERAAILIGILNDELAALNSYRDWHMRIMALDDMEHRCIVLCEGCMPSFFGFPLGCVLRSLVDMFSVKRLLYLQDTLAHNVPEHIQRVQYLKMIVQEYQDQHE